MTTAALGGPALAFALFLASAAAPACDAGKAPYDQGVALEEQGKLVEAAAQYDGVCRRAPDSKFCAPSAARAAEARLHAADGLIRSAKFEDAEAILEGVRDSNDDAGKAKAEARIASADLREGLKWEAAVRNPDKAAILADMEEVGSSSTPIAPKAAEWLAHERAGILLVLARAVCPTDGAACVPTCTKLESLHVGTPEAADAKGLRQGWQQRADARAEQARRDQERKVYPLRVQAERLLKQCAQVYAAQKQHEHCLVTVMAQPTFGDEVMGAVAACGDGSDVARRKDKLDDQWKETLAPLNGGELLDALAKRWTDACDNGEYTAVKLEKPNDTPVGVTTTGNADGGSDPKSPTLPAADAGFVDVRGGAGWGDRCWASLKSGKWGWAKAECDRGMAMSPASPQPRASLLFNEGLIAEQAGDVSTARRLLGDSLALRENKAVRAALEALPP